MCIEVREDMLCPRSRRFSLALNQQRPRHYHMSECGTSTHPPPSLLNFEPPSQSAPGQYLFDNTVLHNAD